MRTFCFAMVWMIFLISCNKEYPNFEINQIGDFSYRLFTDSTYVKIRNLVAYYVRDSLRITYYDDTYERFITLNQIGDTLMQLNLPKPSLDLIDKQLAAGDQIMDIIPLHADSMLFITYNYLLFINENKLVKKVTRRAIMSQYYIAKDSYSENGANIIGNKILLHFGGEFNNPDKKYVLDYKTYCLIDLKDFKVFILPVHMPDFGKDFNKIKFESMFIGADDKICFRYGFDNSIYEVQPNFSLKKIPNVCDYQIPKEIFKGVDTMELEKSLTSSILDSLKLSMKHSDYYWIFDKSYLSTFRYYSKSSAHNDILKFKDEVIFLDILDPKYNQIYTKYLPINSPAFAPYQSGERFVIPHFENREYGVFKFKCYKISIV